MLTVRNKLIGTMRTFYLYELILNLLQKIFDNPDYTHNFLVVSSARSGSSLLVNLLNSHPKISCKGEILNPEFLVYGNFQGQSKARILMHTKAMFFKFRKKNRLGAKLLIHQFDELGLTMNDLMETLNQPKIIILYRKNLLETYVSLKIAQKNNLWYSEKQVNDDSIEIEPEKLLNYVQRQYELWKDVFSSLGKYENLIFLSYESLATDTDNSMSKLFNFFHLHAHKTRTVSVRQNPLPLYLKLKNYEELSKNYDFSDQKWQLDLEAFRREVLGRE